VFVLDPYDFFFAKRTSQLSLQAVTDIDIDLHRYNFEAAEITHLTARLRGVSDIAQSEGPPAAMLHLLLTNHTQGSTRAFCTRTSANPACGNSVSPSRPSAAFHTSTR
jgi:hypothetical protein